ncbi:MAG: zf-HC2 domain-containing protein, partial [Gaiellaceae bacterium]
MSDLERRCSSVSELATRYLAGELTAMQQTSYETHLVVCENCVAYLDDMRTIVERLVELPTDELDPDERRR